LEDVSCRGQRVLGGRPFLLAELNEAGKYLKSGRREMSERENSGLIACADSRSAQGVVLRWIFTLAALTALVFGLAGTSRAQSQSTMPKSAQASTTPAKIAVAETATAAQTATAKPAAQAAPKGQSEGITVHGHWTIEVRNPDGTVVKHVEFENSLAGGGGSAGSNLLAGLLSGLYTPGPWVIVLYGGACSMGPGGPGSQQCWIVSPNATAFVSAYGCSTALASTSQQPFCYATMAESLPPPGSFGLFTTLTLNGAAYVDTSTTISQVGTSQAICSNFAIPPNSPGTVISLATTSPSACSTASNISPNEFTTAIQSVVVSAGQTVEVTVNISFM
jgi:hypothetical protein